MSNGTLNPAPPAAYGICLGASTISGVEVIETGIAVSSDRSRSIRIGKIVLRPHEGNPREVFRQVMDELAPNGAPVLITGRKFRSFVRLPSITEPEAVEYALSVIGRNASDAVPADTGYEAVVSAGGETFMVYALDRDQKIVGISTGNKCASGTGEFFLQQIRRMDLTLDEAVDLATQGEPYPVSGRCSVFCKSDCTHALNRGEPITDVTAGLCRMIAGKILEIIDKVPHERVLLVGGTARNHAVLKYLRRELDDVTVPEEAPYFEALGAAVAAFDRGEPRAEQLFHPGETTFSFLPPLADFEHLVTFNDTAYAMARPGDRCILGLDVGSTTTKAVVIRAVDHALLDSVYIRTNGNPVEASRECFRRLHERLGGAELVIFGLGVTGSGRQIAGLYALTEGIVNEIIAHAAAAVSFDPAVDTIFEIGGQDAKYTFVTAQVASDYAMNQACSAGTGSFLEEAAYETLGIPMEDIAELAIQGESPPNFNDQCAAFISSDIKNASHEGVSRNDILAGLVYSICFNYINRVKGARPVGGKIFMQGGVCYNRAVPLAMAGILHKQIVVPPEPGLMGAFGVALEIEKRIDLGLLPESRFDLEAITRREVSYGETFICPGGGEKCDLKCPIIKVRIDGRTYPFGGSCNRYTGIRHRREESDRAEDYVRIRNSLMFEPRGADTGAEGKDGRGSDTGPKEAAAPVVGLNTSFLTLKLFPLYNTFFESLGCRVVMPEHVVPSAVNRLVTSMCYPAEVSIGLFEDLAARDPDYIFIPHAKELHVPGGIERLDFCSTCGFSRGEGFILKQAYRDRECASRILTPTINFSGGWERGESAFVETAKTIGFSGQAGRRAFRDAVRAQYGFEERCERMGRDLLESLHRNPDSVLIVLFGRAYNAYASEANKGIPQKLRSRGYTVVPFDMLPYQDEPLSDEYAEYMHWEAGQRILRSAQMVRRDPQLFGVYITNFLCAPDSFLVSYFRRVMGRKPSLTLELDAHAADAGINTRIEAFLDVIQNYRKLQQDEEQRARPAAALPHPPTPQPYQPARISYEQRGTVYVDSDGRRFALTDPAVKLLIPPMGILASRALAAACRRIGIRSESLPPSDSEVLRLGRSVTTGKECLPLIICIGALLRYLKSREDERIMMLLPKASGHCRLGQYHVYANQYIREQGLRNVALLDLGMEQRFGGLGPSFGLNAWKGIVISDVMEEIVYSIMALAQDPERGLRVFEEECDHILRSLDGSSGIGLYRQLRATAKRLHGIPLRAAYEETARVALTGEFFVRRDPFSNLGIARRLAERGFLVSTDSVAGIIYYANFMIKEGLVEPEFTLASRVEFFLSGLTQKIVERRIKRCLAVSGLFTPELIDIYDLIGHSEFLIPRDCDGEQGIIAGLTMRDSLTEYCGVANVGPFGCMQTRFADAIIIPQADARGKMASMRHMNKSTDLGVFTEEDRIPFLSVESDGNPYPQLLEARFDAFCLSAARIARRQGKRPAASQERSLDGVTRRVGRPL